jgi:hypothetical protein
MPHHPSISITSISGTLPGLAAVLALHEDTGEALAFRLQVAPGTTPEDPWTATAEAGSGPGEAATRAGQGISHLGPYEAAMVAMQDAVAA